MKESIGNSFIFYIVIIFVFIFIALFVGSTSYTKAFKVKNRIISILEKHSDDEIVSDQGTLNNTINDEIKANLQTVGYRIKKAGEADNCSNYFSKHYSNENATSYTVVNTNQGDYDYCIAKFDTPRGSYYAVITYMYFDTPLLGTKVSIPIYGETKVMGLLN